ncbi:MAG: hypothetical protein EOL95_11340 [Bacteroidia bacterium]|nr:hypothetical protein [Bacteroidia bacterium]
MRFKNSIRSTLSQTSWDALGLASWCVADVNGNVYFAVNGTQRYVYLVSQYNYEPYIVEINDIEISGVISHEAIIGLHYDVDDVAIDGLISHEALIGNDVYYGDVEIEGIISTYLAVGDSVTINDISISGVISSDYTYNADHFAIIDIDISGVISHAESSFAPDHYDIDDIDISGLISYEHVATELQWVSGGTVPVGANECNSTDDVGNTRCTAVCVFEEYDSYISLTNDSNSVSCVLGQTNKITCTRQNPTQWLCTIYEGVQGYTNCEVCTLT